MAIRYGKGLIGGAVVVALLALLVHWIGINTIELYRDDLLFYLQAHLILVLVSMLAALIVGIPAGILLSRPNMVGRAERFIQIFNISNTVPPWPYWPSPSASSASAAALRFSPCSSPPCCPLCAIPTKA